MKTATSCTILSASACLAALLTAACMAQAEKDAPRGNPAELAVELRKAEDSAAVTWEGGAAVVTITSASGIGSGSILLKKGEWPGKILVRLCYAGKKPFERLEGFGAGAADPKTHEARPINADRKNPAEVVLTGLPGKGFPQISIRWVDAYRQ